MCDNLKIMRMMADVCENAIQVVEGEWQSERG